MSSTCHGTSCKLPLNKPDFMNVFVHYKTSHSVNRRDGSISVGSIFAVTSRAGHVGRVPNTQGQDTPVPPRPQYPPGFFAQVLLVVIFRIVKVCPSRMSVVIRPKPCSDRTWRKAPSGPDAPDLGKEKGRGPDRRGRPRGHGRELSEQRGCLGPAPGISRLQVILSKQHLPPCVSRAVGFSSLGV